MNPSPPVIRTDLLDSEDTDINLPSDPELQMSRPEKKASDRGLFGSMMHERVVVKYELSYEFTIERHDVIDQFFAIEEPRQVFGIIAVCIGSLPHDK